MKPSDFERMARRLSAGSWEMIRRAFHARRVRLVEKMRAANYGDTAIAKHLGVTRQYVQKEFPREQPPQTTE